MVTKAAAAPTATLERAIKGAGLVKAIGAIKHLGDNRYWVAASNGDGGYLVNPAEHACTCADNRYRGIACKHLHAVRQAIEPARIRVAVDTAGAVTGWRYATPATPIAPATQERQERIARGRAAAAELFPE